jgi:hypothetical protein
MRSFPDHEEFGFRLSNRLRFRQRLTFQFRSIDQRSDGLLFHLVTETMPSGFGGGSLRLLLRGTAFGLFFGGPFIHPCLDIGGEKSDDVGA